LAPNYLTAGVSFTLGKSTITKIPPMSRKGASGNSFDPEFLTKRLFYLQEFMNSVCGMPDLRGSPHLLTFLKTPNNQFEEAMKASEKSQSPISMVMNSGGIQKKLFMEKKQPLKAEVFQNIQGTAKLIINPELKVLAASTNSMIKETLPQYNK
jgi:PX domain